MHTYCVFPIFDKIMHQLALTVCYGRSQIYVKTKKKIQKKFCMVKSNYDEAPI